MENESGITVNRLYKDKLFKAIFGREENKKYLLSLYNALNGTNYTDESDITFTTIDGAIYMGMKNDVSFLVDTEMNLYEQQSSYNPNMPLRGMVYFSQLYTAYLNKMGKDIYSRKLVKIPTPKYIVFYNGDRDTEDVTKLRLSDAFLSMPDNPSEFEWTATMYNINLNHNKELFEKCKSLHEYSKYVTMVRDGLKRGHTLEEAIEKAMEVAVSENYLDGFFRQQKAEVSMWSLTEFDFDEFSQNRYNEGMEDGISEGARQQFERDMVIIAEKESALAEQANALAEQANALAEKDSVLAEQANALAEKDSVLAEQANALAEQLRRISELEAMLGIK